jgi:hypothetical protein
MHAGEHRVAQYGCDCRVVAVGIQGRPHEKSGFRRRVGDQVDDGLVTDQWFASPVLRDEAEQAVLDLVLLAGARRKVAYLQPRPQGVRYFLEDDVPKARPRAVAPSAIRRDQQ